MKPCLGDVVQVAQEVQPPDQEHRVELPTDGERKVVALLTLTGSAARVEALLRLFNSAVNTMQHEQAAARQLQAYAPCNGCGEGHAQ